MAFYPQIPSIPTSPPASGLNPDDEWTPIPIPSIKTNPLTAVAEKNAAGKLAGVNKAIEVRNKTLIKKQSVDDEWTPVGLTSRGQTPPRPRSLDDEWTPVPAPKIKIPSPNSKPLTQNAGQVDQVDARAAQFEVLKKGGKLSTLTPEQFETLVSPLKSAGWEVGKDYLKPPAGTPTPLWDYQTGGRGATVTGEATPARTDPRAAVGRYAMDILKPLGEMAGSTAKASAQVMGLGGVVGGGSPVEGAKGLYKIFGEPQVDQYKKAMEIAEARGYKDGRRAMADPEVAAHFMAALIPMFGPMAATAGEQLGAGDMRGFSQSMIMLAVPEIFKMVKGGVPLKDAAVRAVEEVKSKAVPVGKAAVVKPVERGFGEVPGTTPPPATTLKEAVKQAQKRYKETTAPRETVTPTNDTPVGMNAAGERLYERSDGSRYRMRSDRADKPQGYPDFGGDLVPTGATKVTTASVDPAQTLADAQDKIRQGIILSPEETTAMKAAGLTMPEYTQPRHSTAAPPLSEMEANAAAARSASVQSRANMGIKGEPEPLTGVVATDAEMAASLWEALKGKIAPSDRVKDPARHDIHTDLPEGLGEVPGTAGAVPESTIVTTPEVPKTILSKLESAAADARTRLDAKAKAIKEGTLKEYGSGGLSTEDLIDYATIGALHITKAGMKFSEWSVRMVEDFGDVIKPHLSEIWARSNGYLKQAIETPEGQKPRSLPKTLEEHGMLGGNERFYSPSPNVRTLDRAEQIASGILDEKGVDGAVEWLRGSDVVGPEQTATGQLLIDKLQDRALEALDNGDAVGADVLMEKAQDVAGIMSVRLTRYGQAVQAVQILEKMHPSRVVQVAQKILDEAPLSKGRQLTTPEKVELVKEAKGIQSTRKKVAEAEREVASSDDPKWQKILDDSRDDLKQQVKKQARRIENLDKIGRIGRLVKNMVSFPKSLWFAFDNSWSGRQGAIMAWSHPIAAAKTHAKTWKALTRSPEQYRAMVNDLQANPMYDLGKKAMGVDYTIARSEGLRSVGSMEDFFQNDWLADKPGIRHSDQGFSTGGNVGRTYLVEIYDRWMRRMGATPETHPWEYKGAGEIINTLTGRSPISPATAEVLGPFLNSARWVKSRAQLLNPVFYGRLAIQSPRAAAMLMKDMMVFTTAVIGTLEVANLAGKYGIADVGTSADPDDADFGKLRVGKSHYDITGGMAQEVRFFARLLKAKRDTDKGFMFKRGPLWVDKTGKIRATPLEIIADFGRRKLAPMPSQAADWLAGDTLDFEKNPKTGKSGRKPFSWNPYPGGVGMTLPKNVVPSGPLSLLVPGKLMLKNFEDAYQEDKWKGVLFAMPEVVGVSTQTYQKQEPKKK